MVRVSVSELKAKLSGHLRRVKAGETVLVTDRGRTIAQLAPPPETEAEDAELQELADAGLVRLGGKVPEEFWTMPRPEDPTGAVRRIVLEQRQSGR